MQTGKANYRLAARLRGNELLLDADLRKAVEEEHLRAVRRAEGLKCCADRRAFAESVEWERLGDFFLRVGSRPSAVRAYRDAALACLDGDYYDHGTEMLPCRLLHLFPPRAGVAPLPVPAASLSADGRNGGGLLRGRRTAARHAGG